MTGKPPDRIVFHLGERLYLRPLETGDVDRCTRWINDPDTRTSLASYLPMSRAAEEKFVEGSANPLAAIHLAIVLNEDDRPIGNLGLNNIRWKDRAAEFGITLGEADCRDRGYGSEATLLLLGYAFESLNLNRVQLGVWDFNLRAIRSYEKVGFVREGAQREYGFVNGRYADHITYSMLAREYFQRKQTG